MKVHRLKLVEHLDLPEARTVNHDDGTVLVIVADLRGTVSSQHLVEPKIKQLQRLWVNRHHRLKDPLHH